MDCTHVGAWLVGIVAAEPVLQASERKEDLIQAHKQFQGSWLLMCISWLQDLAIGMHMAVDPVTGIRSALCRHTAGGSRSKCAHSSGE